MLTYFNIKNFIVSDFLVYLQCKKIVDYKFYKGSAFRWITLLC